MIRAWYEQPPNMALQRTRGLSAAQVLSIAGFRSAVQALPGGRSPLNAVALDATLAFRVLSTVTASLLACSLRGDVGPGQPVPSLEARLRESKIVAVVRILSGETELYSDQIYKARVTDPVKGAEKDAILYFWAGNIGREGYSVGETYLLFLRMGTPFQSDNPKVADAHVKWPSSAPESRFPQDATLYSTSCPHSPIVLRYQGLLDRKGPVFLVPGGCVTLPEALHSETVGARGEPFLRWVAQESLLGYLKILDAKALETSSASSAKSAAAEDLSRTANSSRVSLPEWLRGVRFIGLGRVVKGEVDPLLPETHATVRVEETWWGSAPESVAIGPYAYPRWSHEAGPLGEGQAVVLISLPRSSRSATDPFFLTPIPVVRLNGIDTFRLQDNLGVMLSPSLYVRPGWAWGPINLQAFRDAVRTIKPGV